MNEDVMQQLTAAAERLANAAESLDRVLDRLNAQQETLHEKVDRIVAAVEEPEIDGTEAKGHRSRKLEEQVAELEKANNDLKAQAARTTRKTLSPLVTSLLSKEHLGAGDRLDVAVLNRALQPLSVEQRIAVKAEMARAGMIE